MTESPEGPVAWKDAAMGNILGVEAVLDRMFDVMVRRLFGHLERPSRRQS